MPAISAQVTLSGLTWHYDLIFYSQPGFNYIFAFIFQNLWNSLFNKSKLFIKIMRHFFTIRISILVLMAKQLLAAILLRDLQPTTIFFNYQIWVMSCALI